MIDNSLSFNAEQSIKPYILKIFGFFYDNIKIFSNFVIIQRELQKKW